MASKMSAGDGVSFTKVYEDSTSVYGTAGATYDVANPVPAGMVEEVGIRVEGISALVAPTGATASSLISQIRLTYNGDTVFNFTAQYSDAGNEGQSRVGALCDDIGGRVVESAIVAGQQDMIVWIPLGLQLPVNSRFELSITYTASLTALTVPRFSLWHKYSNAAANTTIIGNATSQPMTKDSQVMMTVAIPNFGDSARVDGIVLQGTGNADTLTGCIVKPLGNFAQSALMLRGNSGANQNGYQYISAGKSLTENQYSNAVPDYYFIPTYGLKSTDGSVVLLITANDNITYTATPVLSLPVSNQSGQQQPTQTASEKTGSGMSILRRAEE